MNRAPILLLVLLAAAVGGCAGASGRAWQTAEMPSHDRERVFQAAREVLEDHFEIARSNWASGTIETRPQVFDRKREGMLTDVRGAGGRWRRTVSFEVDRDGLTILSRAAVRLEREATAAAVALTEASTTERGTEAPRSRPMAAEPGRRGSEEVWVDSGYDAGLARELLAEIASRVREAERAEGLPAGASFKEMADEVRRLGAEAAP